MKTYLDTNILLDIMKESRENHVDSATIFNLAKQGYLEVVISSQSILDAYYVYSISGKRPLNEFKDFLTSVMSVVSIATITGSNLMAAIRSTNNDFEDACQIECALASGCNSIISSDKQLKRESSLTVYTPKEFCDKVFTPWH